jgi:hypothetical protein
MPDLNLELLLERAFGQWFDYRKRRVQTCYVCFAAKGRSKQEGALAD